MNRKILLMLLLPLFLIMLISSVFAVSCTISGEVFNVDGSSASNGTYVNCTNLATGVNYTTTTGTNFPPQSQYYNDYWCDMSCVNIGGSGDIVSVKAYNNTHYGINQTRMIASDSFVNVSMNNTFPVPDTNAPTYSNINEPADPSVYGGSYKFNATWNDDSEVDNVVLTFDNVNYSYKQGDVSKVSGITGKAVGAPSGQGFVYKIYYAIKNFFLRAIGITGQAITTSDGGIILSSGVYGKTFSTLSAVEHNYRWSANDTLGYSNQTGPLSITISPAGNPITLNLQGSPGNKTITYGTFSNAAASAVGTVYLYRNNALVNSGTGSASDNVILANGTYTYFANATGNANYSANATGISYSLAVNKASPSLSLLSSGEWSIITNVSNTFTCTSNNAEADITLYENNTFLNTSASDTVKYSKNYSSTGNFEIKCNRSESQNYTSQNVSNTLAVTVAPVCGDGSCNGAETCSTCSADCGTCSTGNGGGGGGGGGGTTGGGGGGAAVLESYSLELYEDYNSYLEISLEASRNAVINVSTENSTSKEQHTITISSIDFINKKVTLTFASAPFDVVFGVNETKLVDINQDGLSDISVTLEEIVSYTRAKLTFKKISACGNGICENKASETKTSCCIDCGCEKDWECKNNQCVKSEEKKKIPSLPAYAGSLIYGSLENLLGFIVLIALIIWLIVFKIIRMKEHKQKDKSAKPAAKNKKKK